MKNNIYNILSFLFFVIAITSCSTQNQDLTFEESASVRLENSLNQYSSSLQSSELGWVFEYYPDRSQSYGGTNYIVDFDKDNTVDVYSDNSDFATPVTSSYQVIANGGAVLTFNTYNSLLHRDATPNRFNYQARDGDYEFLFLSEEDNLINVKGKRTGNILKLIKLTESPEVYLTKVRDVKDVLSKGSLFIEKDGEFVSVSSQNRNLTFSGLGEDGEDLTIAYIVTDKGIKLYESTIINGNEVVEFVLSDTKTQLVSLSGNVTLEVVSSPIDMNFRWATLVAPVNASASYIKVFDEINEANKINFAAFPLSFEVVLGEALGRRGILLKIGPFSTIHNLLFNGVIGSPDQLSIEKSSPDLNWQFVPYFDPMVNLIVDNSPYTVTFDGEKKAKLTSTVDSEFWFFLERR